MYRSRYAHQFPCEEQTPNGHILTSPIGMYALRERRQHVTQEDFEFAVAKVGSCVASYRICTGAHQIHSTGSEKEPGREHFCQQAILMICAPVSHSPVVVVIILCVIWTHTQSSIKAGMQSLCSDGKLCQVYIAFHSKGSYIQPHEPNKINDPTPADKHLAHILTNLSIGQFTGHNIGRITTRSASFFEGLT